MRDGETTLDLEGRTALTYRNERWRAVAGGVIETAGTTFLLLIAVRWFAMGPTGKALVAGGGSIGFLLSPAVVVAVARMGWPANVAAARLALVGGLSFLCMALIPAVEVFVLGSVIGLTTSSAAVPLLTQIYQENYPPEKRGHLFSRTVMIRIGTAALFSELAGRALSGNIEQFRWLLAFFSLTCFGAFYFLGRYPSRPLTVKGGMHPLRGLRFARTDAVFRRTLVCWMLMGFANLMMLPLRVEYLANPKYGLSMTVQEIAFLTGVLPNLVRLLMSPIWGMLFDRMNFFVLRITLNAGFGLGILAFFASDGLWGLIFGAVVFGFASSGGDVAWSLWVTKLAPPDHVADYMSVHTFFTGVRGVAAPLVAFHAVRDMEMQTLGWVSVGMIVVSSLLLLPEVKRAQGRMKGQTLIEEVSE